MAKPTADTDKELIQQIKNLKEGIEERIQELKKRNFNVFIEVDTVDDTFTITISKHVEFDETV